MIGDDLNKQRNAPLDPRPGSRPRKLWHAPKFIMAGISDDTAIKSTNTEGGTTAIATNPS